MSLRQGLCGKYPDLVISLLNALLPTYEKLWDMVSVERTLCNSGWRKGVAERKAEGLARGLRIAALNMKKQGMDNATIANCTSLDIRIVDSLKSLLFSLHL